MKIASEKALNEMKDDNFLPTILRLGTVFGASNRLRFDLVVNLLTAKALRLGHFLMRSTKTLMALEQAMYPLIPSCSLR